MTRQRFAGLVARLEALSNQVGPDADLNAMVKLTWQAANDVRRAKAGGEIKPRDVFLLRSLANHLHEAASHFKIGELPEGQRAMIDVMCDSVRLDERWRER